MKNWRTTVYGVIAALGTIFPALGLPAEVGQALATLGVFLLGWNAKDNKVTGIGS